MHTHVHLSIYVVAMLHTSILMTFSDLSSMLLLEESCNGKFNILVIEYKTGRHRFCGVYEIYKPSGP